MPFTCHLQRSVVHLGPQLAQSGFIQLSNNIYQGLKFSFWLGLFLPCVFEAFVKEWLQDMNAQKDTHIESINMNARNDAFLYTSHE